ncbi:hypothetical protein MAP00_008544 [Monascus purpureus]|nr:hypothetical protein MAP00_008544 [Monascus purpureus]
MHWSFYALLARFARYGPVDEKKGTRWNLSFRSAESELPFPPDSVDYPRWLARHIHRDSGYKGDPLELEKYTARPEWLAKFLLSEIYCLFT